MAPRRDGFPPARSRREAPIQLPRVMSVRGGCTEWPRALVWKGLWRTRSRIGP
ncbi:hypothetical protein ACFFX0_27830 [Citricoccus parietis]|uniref:Uncharacterized protein n=1 Tax=Citricoccus parietis TaxID=592307 RepID=A0ABV5G861_9MICC